MSVAPQTSMEEVKESILIAARTYGYHLVLITTVMSIAIMGIISYPYYFDQCRGNEGHETFAMFVAAIMVAIEIMTTLWAWMLGINEYATGTNLRKYIGLITTLVLVLYQVNVSTAVGATFFKDGGSSIIYFLLAVKVLSEGFLMATFKR